MAACAAATTDALVPVLMEEGLGFVQRCSYRHPDLYHEDVLEIDSPLAPVCAAGVQSFQFLLMGDQNAGKSTFLHCFTNEGDAHFVELASLLPILHSSFSNTRYLDPSRTTLHMMGDASAVASAGEAAAVLATPYAMDELPFLDTDLGSGSVLITRENFEFFLFECNLMPGRRVATSKLLSALTPDEEEALKPPLLEEDSFVGLYDDPENTRYVLLQFQEIGGDLLDLIMLSDDGIAQAQQSAPIPTDHMRVRLKVREKTLAWLANARKTVYFVNATSLLDMQQLRVSLDVLAMLLERMDFLNKMYPYGHDVLLHVSRIPVGLPSEDAEVLALVNELSDTLYGAFGMGNAWRGRDIADASPPLGVQFSEEAPAASSKAPWLLSSLLLSFLVEAGKARKWALRFLLPHALSHLDDDGSINSSGVMQTLVALFQHGMINSHAAFHDSVAKQLVVTASKLTLREWSCDGHQGHLVDWLDIHRFHEELVEEEHNDDGQVPQHSALAAFDSVCNRLYDMGLCIKDQALNDARMVELRIDDSVHYWSPSRGAVGRPTETRVRMLQYAPEANAIFEGCFESNIPLDMWTSGEVAFQNDATRRLLGDCLRQLLSLFSSTFLKTLAAPESKGVIAALAYEIDCILEELCLVARVLGIDIDPVQIPVRKSSSTVAALLQERLDCRNEPLISKPFLRILLVPESDALHL